MTLERPPQTVTCPHCGGEIKAAAKLCKHCRRDVSIGEASSSPSIASPARPLVLDEFREFLEERAILSAENRDTVWNNATDVAGALNALANSGLIAAAQVDTVRESFRAHQVKRLGGTLQAAVVRGLLTSAQVESALASFESVLLTQTPGEYVVARGLLTSVQAAELRERSAAPAPIAFLGRLYRDRKFGRPLLFGPVAMLLLVPLLMKLGMLRRGGDALALLLPAPLIAVLWAVWKGSSGLRRAVWGLATVAALFISAATGAALNIGEMPYVPSLQPECTMSGDGRGRCVFSNTSSNPRSACGQIVASCTPRRGNPQTRTSATICSGPVEPNRTTTLFFTVAEFDLIVDRAVPVYSDWRNFCQFHWETR